MAEPDVNDVPVWMVEALEISEAQAHAGETVPLESFLDELRESIARMEAREQGRGTAAE